MKSYLKFSMTIFTASLVIIGCATPEDEMTTFPPNQVTLMESPFTQAREADLDYMFELEPDRLLAPFLEEANLEPKAPIYGNWEGTGLGGHTAGHYLTALSRMYATTGSQEALDRLNYMISELRRCQEANGNGYVGGVPDGMEMWAEIAAGNIDAEPFGLNDRWVPWYNLHKLYAGLRDAYWYADNQQAREVLVDLSEWSLNLVSDLSDEQIQEMLRTEHGGMNEVFADVSVITGDDRYLDLAKRFSHRAILDPLMAEKDSLTGLHANTQIPKVIGFERIAQLEGNPDWHRAAQFFWETVIHNRSVVIGGNSVREHFNPTDDFSEMIQSRQGPETCNTYNMLRLSKLLYEADKDIKYIDYYEQALFNHILSSQHPGEGGFVYFTPMRPQHYRVYSQPDSNFWCCVGSGMENHSKYGDMIYAHEGAALYVNLFIPSRLQWPERGISLTQATQFPDEAASVLTIQAESPVEFTLNVRHPSWVKEGEFSVMVNGEEVAVNNEPDTYAGITREWQAGDRIEIQLPMETRVEQLPDGSEYYAILHGPIVLAAETSTDDLDGLFADASRMGHVADGELYPLENAPQLMGDPAEFAAAVQPVAGQPMTFTASDIITQQQYKDLRLIPFFRVHDARYVIYWPHASAQ